MNPQLKQTSKQHKVLFWHFRKDFGPFCWEDRPLRFARACNTVVPKQLVLPHSYHFVSREFCEFYPKFDYILDITTTEFFTWSIKSFQKLYRVSHIEMFLLNWLWQIEICKLDFAWRYLCIPEVMAFEFHPPVFKKVT